MQFKAEIKIAELKDKEILNRISIESKMHWNYPLDWIENWKDDLTLKENDFSAQSIFKLELSGSIIGFCAIREHNKNYEITHLWLEPEYIGKGFGKLLLNETIKKVVKKDKPIIVEADPNAESFYKSQGFETFDKIESYPKGRFLPVMKKMSK